MTNITYEQLIARAKEIQERYPAGFHIQTKLKFITSVERLDSGPDRGNEWVKSGWNIDTHDPKELEQKLRGANGSGEVVFPSRTNLKDSSLFVREDSQTPEKKFLVMTTGRMKATLIVTDEEGPKTARDPYTFTTTIEGYSPNISRK